MSTVEEIKSLVNAAMDEAGDAATGMAGVVDKLDEAISRLRLVTTGSLHPKAEETIQRLEQAKDKLAEAQQLARGAADSAAEYRSTI